MDIEDTWARLERLLSGIEGIINDIEPGALEWNEMAGQYWSRG